MVNKQILTQERKAKKIPFSEEKTFLTNLYNNTRVEITKVNGYLNGLNNNIKIIKKLLEEGVDSRPVFYPLNQMPMFRSIEKFPISTNISRRGISLPSSINLVEQDIIKITNLIKDFPSRKH